MGPKKNKDVTDDENYWKILIEEAPLNDETWTVKVILIEAAGSEQDRMYLNKFENYAAEERRFVVKNICKTETIFMINQLGGEKKIKDDKLRVFEEGQMYLKEKKDVPEEIMALIIKHLILKMKEEYLFIERQRLEVREGMKKESLTMIDKAEVKGIVNIKTSEPQELVPVPPSNKKKEQDTVSKPIEIDENKKYSTFLRVRGEEWRDKIYIDDYPIDGPNLYVAVTGFLQPNLAGCLIKVGIPLTAVVQIRIDPLSTTIPSNLFQSTKRGLSQNEMLVEKFLKFWENIQQQRINKITSNNYKNTAFIVFKPPYWDNETLSDCNERIYDELCYLMYDVQDLTRQHLHYLDNMDIIPIPEENEPDSSQLLYHNQVDGIPLESTSVYLVLDAILQTVCSKDKTNSTSVSSLNESLNISHQRKSEEIKLNQAETLVKSLLHQFCKPDPNEKEYEVSNGDEYKNCKNISIINYGNFCKYSTFHLDHINLENIVCSMMYGMPVNKLWQNRSKPSEEINIRNSFHINAILSCFERKDVETSELIRLIHILACRKLYNNRSSLKKPHILPSTIAEFQKTYLKRSILTEPLAKYSIHKCRTSTSHSLHSSSMGKENSYESINDSDNARSTIEKLFECPDLSELVSATEITTQSPINHMIDDFEFFQDFSGSSALQITLDAFNKYNCIDYKYCEVTDCFIAMFYNSHDTDGISREEWRYHLPTPLCLQDFFDFVLEEHYDWIKNEEKLYDDSVMVKSQSEYHNTKSVLPENTCVENSNVALELLIEGSLKYDEINNDELIDLETSNSKIFSSKKTHTPVSTTDMDSMKSSRKTKSPAMSTPKVICPDSGEEGSIDLPKKPFFGYDLGDRRLEVFGRDSTYFAKDGTHISSSYSLLIPMNFEFVNLNIIPGNFNSEFWIHKALGEVDNANAIAMAESFRIDTKDHLIINLKKQVYKAASSISNPMLDDILNKTDTVKSPASHISNLIAEDHGEKSYHSLLITWPNGLITESVHENNSPIISHIKQHYISLLPNLEEDMRCISLNGEVVIFKNNNEIDVLKSDSSYIKILKCEKKIVKEENIDSIHSVTNSDKSKKGKDKHPKISTKPSKKVLVNECKEMHSEETEYELFIEEFEVTNVNGLRQKWIQSDKFDIEKLLIKTATDYCLGEIFSKRSDGATLLLNKDGEQVVTFPNKTRIITGYIIEDKEIYPEWTEEEIDQFSINSADKNVQVSGSENDKNGTSNLENDDTNNSLTSMKVTRDGYISIYLVYTIEHPYFNTVTINKLTGSISIRSPNECCVTFDTELKYNFSFDEQTSAYFDGENLNIKYCACSECNANSTCVVKIKSPDMNSESNLNWLRMVDSNGKKISVDEEGNINVIEETSDQNLQETHFDNSEESIKSVHSIITENTTTKNVEGNESHHQCKESWKEEPLKFFILHRDLTCSELVHRETVKKYKEICLRHPWCSINSYDTFGDHRKIWSILTPIQLTESEKWLMESKLLNKPTNLTFKHLVKDTGKGFYHWMRPYGRFKPKPIKPHPLLKERLPRAFILRTLEQQWDDSQTQKLKGAKELVKAVLCYRNLMESDSQIILNVPIRDQRLQNEISTDDTVQAIADRIHTDLKCRLIDYAQKTAKRTLTTASRSDTLTKKELSEESQKMIRICEQNMKNVEEIETVTEISPNLKRYWLRRAEEYKEEQFYKYLLREGSVPPYFRNVLGGAIWWDVSKTADDAVTDAERVKCACDDQKRDNE